MKKVLAAAMTALALTACGGPLEDETQLMLPQSQGQGLENVALRTPGSALKTPVNYNDVTLARPTARNEERWYAPCVAGQPCP